MKFVIFIYLGIPEVITNGQIGLHYIIYPYNFYVFDWQDSLRATLSNYLGNPLVITRVNGTHKRQNDLPPKLLRGKHQLDLFDTIV